MKLNDDTDDGDNEDRREYRMAWSSPLNFAVWESGDGSFQFTDPNGRILVTAQVESQPNGPL